MKSAKQYTVKTAAVMLILSIGLVACSNPAPSPDWQLQAQSASERAVKAYLKGEQGVADVEWSKAFAEVSATGQPAAMARMALLQCAAQTAALEMTDCPRYQRYASGSAPAEQAYARYLAAAHSAADIALLPQAQQAVAAQLLAENPVVHALPQAQALSQLTAAGVALRAGAISPHAVQQAVQIASEQGWRRAVMAWLLVQQRMAQAAGDAASAQAIELRLRVLQENQSTSKSKK